MLLCCNGHKMAKLIKSEQRIGHKQHIKIITDMTLGGKESSTLTLVFKRYSITEEKDDGQVGSPRRKCTATKKSTQSDIYGGRSKITRNQRKLEDRSDHFRKTRKAKPVQEANSHGRRCGCGHGSCPWPACFHHGSFQGRQATRRRLRRRRSTNAEERKGEESHPWRRGIHLASRPFQRGQAATL